MKKVIRNLGFLKNLIFLFVFIACATSKNLPYSNITADLFKVSNEIIYNAKTGEIIENTYNGKYLKYLDAFKSPVCKIVNRKLNIELSVPTLDPLSPNYPVSDVTVKGIFIHTFSTNVSENISINLEKDGKPISFIYIDKNVILNGIDQQKIMNFQNVTLKKGWNIIISEWIEKDKIYIVKNETIDSSRWVLWDIK
jgi:hypothetical protein